MTAADGAAAGVVWDCVDEEAAGEVLVGADMGTVSVLGGCYGGRKTKKPRCSAAWTT
jgi:hypothetical protein